MLLLFLSKYENNLNIDGVYWWPGEEINDQLRKK